MAPELEVWLFADRVGTLALVDGRLNFCYVFDWLSRPDAVALSASLPLQAEPFDDRKTRPFFAGLLPEMKYQNEGGPDLAQCFNLVRSATRPSAPQVLRLFDYVIFNALIGNHDAHAKNFSLLYSGKAPVLAPFYDTLSTAVYPTLTPKMAMKIGSKYKFSEVQARHWEQFAEGVGFTKAQAKRRILELAKSLPTTARKLQSDPGHSFGGNAVVEQINALIEQRCALTIRRLTEPAAENDAAAEPLV